MIKPRISAPSNIFTVADSSDYQRLFGNSGKSIISLATVPASMMKTMFGITTISKINRLWPGSK